uniref:TNFR-Cys domain-containing protein n=1 Tax=Gadus morhua TaxID=8049 RepID=A0A8C4Z009_GADMO
VSLIMNVNKNWKMFFFNVELIFQIHLLLFHIYFIDNATASANCRPAEYSTEEGCCPTCPPGMYVSRHCTGFRSTSCLSCTEGTFQDGDNGREQCFACKLCDAGLGLKVTKSCTSVSDAECEVLDGFFCSDSNRGGCRAAQRHTVCSPGHYIGQRGTADKDTECLHCTDGTFSNGTSTSCQNHTNPCDLLPHCTINMTASGPRWCVRKVEFLINNPPFVTAWAFLVHWRRRG